jgi:hypothetical protein
MNRYMRDLVQAFRAPSNAQMLRGTLSGHFRDPAVDNYLKTHFAGSIEGFISAIEHEMMDSEPIHGVDLYDELAEINQRFIDEQSEFIRDFMRPEQVPVYGVNDGRPTTRLGTGGTADQMLDSWWYARRQPQFRDDTSEHGTVRSDFGGREVTGVTFCDQSHLGTQNHVDQYENTSTKFALNKYRPHEATEFGVSTPGADERLLSRRIFRSEGGVENGIPARQRWLHNRHNERNVDETMQSSRDNQVRGFDMRPIHKRMDGVIKSDDPARMDLRTRPRQGWSS